MIVLFVVLLALLGLFTVGIASLRAVPEYAVPVVVTLFTLQLVGWVLTPLVAFGVDETVDPARFALLPLRAADPATWSAGVVVDRVLPGGQHDRAARCGDRPRRPVVGAAGRAGLRRGADDAVVVLSRAASTSMSALMTSRRGRDLGMVVGFGYSCCTWGSSR